MRNDLPIVGLVSKYSKSNCDSVKRFPSLTYKELGIVAKSHKPPQLYFYIVYHKFSGDVRDGFIYYSSYFW